MLDIQKTKFDGLYIGETSKIADKRGAFGRLYCEKVLAPFLGSSHIVQINQSLNKNKATKRGLHYQLSPHAEKKIVRCINGQAFDVAVDLRRESPTFLQSFTVILDAEAQNIVCIPEGFAHGFQTLTDNCELLYLHSEYYQPEFERGLNCDDPRLSINWPIPNGQKSDRDEQFPLMEQSFRGITL